MKKLKQQFDKVATEYLNAFCKNYELYCEFWVADEIGGVASCSDYFLGGVASCSDYFLGGVASCSDYFLGGVASCSDYFFSFNDIRFCVDNAVDEKTLFDWYDYNLPDKPMDKAPDYVNLENYHKGFRRK